MCFVCILVTDERTAVGDERIGRLVEGRGACYVRSLLHKQITKVLKNSPIFGVWTFYVLTFFEVSLQVHGEQRGARGVVGASNWSVVTTGFVFSAEKTKCWEG